MGFVPRRSALVLAGVLAVTLATPGCFAPPVAPHLMESGASPFDRKHHFGMVVEAYRLLGYSSLLIDYSGVGLSDGTRSPVDPANVTAHGARVLHGRLAGWLAALLFRSASGADLEKALREMPELLVFIAMGQDDLFVTDGWRGRFHSTTVEGPRVDDLLPVDHVQLSGQSRDMLVSTELPFLVSQVPLTPPFDGRNLRRRLAEIILRPRSPMNDEAREALLDVSDLSGTLPLDLQEDLSRARRFSRPFDINITVGRDVSKLVRTAVPYRNQNSGIGWALIRS